MRADTTSIPNKSTQNHVSRILMGLQSEYLVSDSAHSSTKMVCELKTKSPQPKKGFLRVKIS